ncbi:hypothetical protein Q5P01_016549 [Channa striata]|uniref:Cadherin-1 n=1 Tax=Channa striata TaxID=64152 RepID=A0AA88M8C2_CHASR|nr:hypothetical protein Q5P01_016549 [Channa striata]
MGPARFAVFGLLLVLIQASAVEAAEEPTCISGFESDLLIFKVTRKHLRSGTRLGKVGFTDCTDRTRFLFSSDDNRFMVQTDGMLKVKRALVLHEGHRDFFIHSWDSQGHKMTVPIRVLYDSHQHEVHHQNERHSHQHHLIEVDSINYPESATDPESKSSGGLKRRKRELVIQPLNIAENTRGPFPQKISQSATDPESKSSGGLKRRKREWVIPPLNIAENTRGPFPLKISQIRSSEDKLKKIYYSITGPGADQPPVGLFSMDRGTGILYVTQPLDREKQAKYTFQAHAVAEGAGNAEAPMEIVVNVMDQNDNKPVFSQDTYLGDVAEASPIGFEVITVVATDADEPGNDNSDLRYRILSQDPKLPSDNLFTINPVSGVIRVNTLGLDRENYPKYTLLVQAADMMGEGLHGEAKVILTVTDSNDNAPAYQQPTYEASVDENKADAVVVKMLVTDADEPHTPAWNAKFRIVSGDPGGLFNVTTGTNKQEGIITTTKGLDFEMNRKHVLLVAVENEVPFAFPLPTATATVTVNVQDVNEPPVFVPAQKTVSKLEDLPVNSDVTTYTATDPDSERKQKVTYKIISDPAGWLNVSKETGQIRVKSTMDRESDFVRDNKYIALIGAYDDDSPPATGTGTLIIQLEDVNDNAPTIEERALNFCNKEPIPQYLTVTDKDGPGFSSPYSVSLQGSSKTNWTAKMNSSKTGIILALATNLPSGEYTVILRVSDNQGLEQDSTLKATVCDCTGEFENCRGPDRIAGVTDLPVILGILGGILLLLMLVLLLLLFARRRKSEKKEPLLQDNDIRDNIYYYDEEGGGEDDQDYDLSVLHRGLDNRPEVFRNDVMPNFMPAPQYRPRPANPEEIGNFIDDNLKAADNDPTAPPYDSLLVFDYEGGGSDAGSLSSLNSSSSGDQDYNCLSEWGPRFKKLADMYGGGEDDML